MERELEGQDQRRIQIQTSQGAIEGVLRMSAGVSTLHYLNVVSVSQNFLTLLSPTVSNADWAVEEGGLSVYTDSILFVVELSDFVPKPGDPTEAARFKRAPVRLRVAEYTVDGFLWVPPGGNPIARLNQDRHAFIALTSASVIGPRSEFAAPFVAVNRSYIVAAQATLTDEPAVAAAAVCEETRAD